MVWFEKYIIPETFACQEYVENRRVFEIFSCLSFLKYIQKESKF